MGLVTKLVEVSKAMGFLSFDKQNTGQGYSYASAAGVIRKLQTELNKQGILCHCVDSQVQVITVGDKHKPHATVTERYRFSDGSEELFAVGVGSGTDSGDKAVMKASTAAFKYAIAHAFTLAWGAEDPEADESTDKDMAPARVAKSAPKGKTKEVSPASSVVALHAQISDMILKAKQHDRNWMELEIKPKIGELYNLDRSTYDKLVQDYVATRDKLFPKEE